MKTLVFCDTCGKPMKTTTENNEKKWKCICGFIKNHEGDVISVEKISKKQVGEGVFPNEKREGFPHKCKKCGHGKADVDTISAFYSDESDISLYRCQKCGHVERQTDGTGN